jgi:hypothetical protein
LLSRGRSFRSCPELLSKVTFAAYGAEHKCEFVVWN